MKVVKRELPEGVRKKFVIKIGKKMKILNSLYYGPKAEKAKADRKAKAAKEANK